MSASFGRMFVELVDGATKPHLRLAERTPLNMALRSAFMHLRKAYMEQRQSAQRRGISFDFPFPLWLAWWLKEERHLRRGVGRDKLCMARNGDEGGYEWANVHPATHSENFMEASPEKRRDAHRRVSEARRTRGTTARRRAEPVRTPAGRFPSVTAARLHHGVSKGTATRRLRKGIWQYAGTVEEAAAAEA